MKLVKNTLVLALGLALSTSSLAFDKDHPTLVFSKAWLEVDSARPNAINLKPCF